MKLSRRDFLKGSAALTAMGVLGACTQTTETTGETTTTTNAVTSEPVMETKTKDFFALDDVSGKVSSTEDFDVVVVGAGNGGCVAAISAADLGAKVAWVEKTGTVITWAGEMGALNSKVAKEKFGVSYTLEERNEIVNDICRYASYENDQKLVKLWAENSGRTMDWYVDMMEAKGVHMFLETDMKQTIYKNIPQTHTVYKGDFIEMGPNMMGSQIANPVWSEYGDEMNVSKFWSHTAVQLVQDSSKRITGIIVKKNDSDEYIQLNASKGVILSTGGYSGNTEMMDALHYRDKNVIVNNLGASFANGDGIKMAVQAGAAIDANHAGGIAFDRAALDLDHHTGAPYASGLADIWWPGSQPWLKVNTLGERFMNEDNTYDFNIYGGITQPNHFWFQIFDSNYWEDVQAFHTTICSRVVAAKGARNSEVLPGVFPAKTKEEYDNNFMKGGLESGRLVQADTIDELASKLGLPVDTFKATVARYNELAHKGYDDDYGKQSKDLRPIEVGPFYGIALGEWLLATFNGVRVNTNLEAVDNQGKALGGLYVVGNDMGGFFANSYPQMYGGLAQGKTTCFARLAALHAITGSIYED